MNQNRSEFLKKRNKMIIKMAIIVAIVTFLAIITAILNNFLVICVAIGAYIYYKRSPKLQAKVTHLKAKAIQMIDKVQK